MTGFKNFLSQVFSTNGDGTGGFNLALDFSVTAEQFKISPPVGESFAIRRINITFVDDPPMSAPPLTEGIKMEVFRDGQVVRSLTPQSIMSFEDLLLYTSGVVDISPNPSKASFVIYFDFRAMYEVNGVLRLDGDRNEELIVTISDDLSSLESIKCTAFGINTGQLI